MKIAPIIKEINRSEKVSFRLVHTGQHFDHNMSGAFFEQLNIPLPDANLMCSGGSHAFQTASIMNAFEAELNAHRPDMVLVVGDVNSTMACTIAAKKLNILVAHVEAGIRSGDKTMPEEINRMVTDSIADIFFTTTQEASDTLVREGHDPKYIHLVGNTMIDTLYNNLDKATGTPVFGDYLVMTLHRPSNVDDPAQLKALLQAIDDNCGDKTVIFPVHPRTRKALEELEYERDAVILTSPKGYHEFLYLIKNSSGVITDSGGITEETTVLGIPCMTLRNTTERPETITIGTNELIGTDPKNVAVAVAKMANGNWKTGSVPDLWDGNTAKRIVDVIGYF